MHISPRRALRPGAALAPLAPAAGFSKPFCDRASQARLRARPMVSRNSAILPTAETRSATASRNPLPAGAPIGRSLGGDAEIRRRDQGGPGTTDVLRGNLDATTRASVNIVAVQARHAC